ncbi:MAG: transketolase [Desulfamplus sp.]|nr:transketolase [Desulfamplus sp.]
MEKKNSKEQKLTDLAQELRKHIITMNCHAGSGHPGGSLSAVEIITFLFHKEMNFSFDNYRSPERDRFVLSKGHACLVLYAALAQKGFFDTKEFEKLRHVNGMLQGHPDRLKTPGVEFNSGSLGQGFSFSLGCALGGKRTFISRYTNTKPDYTNQNVLNREFRVYTIIGDGELNEGQVWEGFMFGAFHKLDNLVAIVDYNKYQSDDLNSNITALEPLMDKFRSFGWYALEIDGHNFEQIENSFLEARALKGKPTVILAHTVKGKGISFMENNPKWHGSLCPSGDEKIQALKDCGYGECVE